MFRWPVEFTSLSLGSHGQPREAVLEVTPRGAIFTLAALSQVGHPAHLALIDAYLKGQVRLTPTVSIGEDCRLVASSLAVPLLAAFELGVERLTLADLAPLPRGSGTSQFSDRAADGHPNFTRDSPRLLVRAGGLWNWVQGAERFEAPGCLGTRNVGLTDQWYRVMAELPNGEGIEASTSAGRWPAPIVAEVRAPTGEVDRATPDSLARTRESARGQPRRSTVLGHPLPLPPALATLSELCLALASPIGERRPADAALLWRDLRIDVRLIPNLDGYQALWLLPPTDVEPAELIETMRELTWGLIETLIGRPLPEHRTEPIALRVLGQDGRSTTLNVGASVVMVRNQTVFAAWVGSDGRVMLKLLPPGGMAAW